jgi:regulator of PEP synthase PpsR (kinase-PPPase family)
MDAVNFALAADDGANIKDYAQAQVIVVGVSRSGKTPTCLFLSLRYGIYAANYPLVEKDLDEQHLPAVLKPHRDRLFGLAIDPARLHEIRSARQPGSDYAALRTCEYETRQAQALFRAVNIPWLSATTLSVEEIAASVVDRMGLADVS